MTTLWVSHKIGGPYEYVSTLPNKNKLDLEPTHSDMKLTEEEFNAAANILAESLDYFDIPEQEKNEVLDAFIEHEEEVVNKLDQ